MPRPRFDKLKPEKRERILEAAARLFAAQGYEGASLNQILADAGISKGAAYYYFDDKADLYMTTVLHYTAHLVDGLEFELAQLTADTFWPTFTALYTRQFTDSYERPWIFQLVKSAGRALTDLPPDAPLMQLVDQVQGNLLALLKKGQALGVIRTDLPDDLLLRVFVSLDDAGDRWLLAHWSALSQAEIEARTGQIVSLFKRLLAPEQSHDH